MIHLDQNTFKSQPESGFSLVEMIVILTIISLVSAMAFTRFSVQVNQTDAKSALRSLAALANRVRQTAITQGRVTTLILDTRSKTYSSKPSGSELDLGADMEMKVETAGSLIEGETARIIFNPDGSSSGGTIFLKDGSGRSGKLAISWITGASVVSLTGEE